MAKIKFDPTGLVDILGNEDNDVLGKRLGRNPPSTKKKPEKVVRMPLGEGKPSAFDAMHRARLRDKEILTFGKIPKFVFDEFQQRASSLGLGRIQYLYYLLRKDGVDIPPDSQMDGRRL